MHYVSQAWKQPRLWDFLNQDKNKDRPNFEIQIVKQEKKNKNTTHAKQKFNNILLQRRKKRKTRLWQESVPQIGVKCNKSNGEFYLYLYPLGT